MCVGYRILTALLKIIGFHNEIVYLERGNFVKVIGLEV